MSVAEQSLDFVPPSVHDQDHRMLLLKSAADIELLGSEQFKGGIQRDAMPQSVMDFMLSLSDRDIEAIRAKRVPIDPVTGATRFTDEMRATLSEETLAFIDEVSREFNKMGDWQAEFLIQRDLGTKQINEGFHLDSKSSDVPRMYRGFINVSSIPEDRQHETEWVSGDGLSAADLKRFTRDFASTPLTDLPQAFRAHAHWVKSGDMFFTKGFGDGKRDIETDGPLHRAPPFKDDYAQRGERRDALIWQRTIFETIDPA